jgi:hypothetical protein
VPLRVGLERTLAYFRRRLEQGAGRDRRRFANGGRPADPADAAGGAPVDRRRPVATTTGPEYSLG